MSAPLPPPPRTNSNVFPQSHSISHEHGGNSWPGSGKIKNNPIGGHYAGHYGLGAGAKIQHHQAEEDNFSADTGIEKMVDQQIESFVPKAIVSKKSDPQEMHMLQDELSEGGEEGEQEIQPHHHHDVSRHLADQSAKISKHFESRYSSMS